MRINNQKNHFETGKNYALYLLNYHDWSKLEMAKKLKKKRYPENIIEEVLQFLEEKKLINDRRFTREWIRKSIKKGLASSRIEYELKSKGVNEEIIKEIVSQIFSNIDEEKMALELLYKKKYLPFQNGLSKKEKLKQFSKIHRFLSNRGFSYSIIKKVGWEENLK